MAILSLSVLVASITFACYKAQWWPFTLLLPASWRLQQQLKHATTATSGLEPNAANARAAKLGPASSVASDTTSTKKEQTNTPQLRLSSPTTSATPPSNQQATSTASSMRPTTPSGPGDSQLMPPPPVPNRSPNRTVPTSNASSSFLRTPPTASPSRLPNRNPTRLSQPTSSSLSPPANRTASLLPPASASRAPTAPRTAAAGTVATSSAANPRRKVILAPGHSPLDWAALTRSGSNLSGVPFPQRVTPSQLAAMNGRKGKPAWSSFQGKVYNIGPYLPFHPGGEGELKRAAGRVGDRLFMEVHPWVNWEGMMGECLVGFLVDETEGKKAADEGLEGMD